MNFASAETTNLFLLTLSIVAIVQFLLLVAVLVQVKSAMARLRAALPLIGDQDIPRLQRRLSRLLDDVETLVAKGNNVVGAVERGAQDLGAAASVVGHSAQRAMEVSSFKARAVTAAVRVGLRFFLGGRPFGQRAVDVSLPPVHPGAPSQLN
ncbi:MAG: hypothetical protein ABL986_17235 [Vicinamibacterales bacterium]